MVPLRMFVQGVVLLTFLHCVNNADCAESNEEIFLKRNFKRELEQTEESKALSQHLEGHLVRKKRSENGLTSSNNQTQLRTHKVNSILFGDHCFWIRLIFFIVPFYFCPTTTVVEYNVSSLLPNDTDVNLSDKFGQDIDENDFYSSPIDLIPAKPRRPLSRAQPPAHHGKSVIKYTTDLTRPTSSFQDLSTATTRRVPEFFAPTQKPLNRCTNAIISCCRNGSTKVDNTCFENMSCPGPFWDFNPCDPENVKSARNAASMVEFP